MGISCLKSCYSVFVQRIRTYSHSGYWSRKKWSHNETFFINWYKLRMGMREILFIVSVVLCTLTYSLITLSIDSEDWRKTLIEERKILDQRAKNFWEIKESEKKWRSEINSKVELYKKEKEKELLEAEKYRVLKVKQRKPLIYPEETPAFQEYLKKVEREESRMEQSRLQEIEKKRIRESFLKDISSIPLEIELGLEESK